MRNRQSRVVCSVHQVNKPAADLRMDDVASFDPVARTCAAGAGALERASGTGHSLSREKNIS